MIRSRRIAILSVAATLVVESRGVFVGPGLIECSSGECDFSVQPGLLLSDPCHIYTSNHPYEESFEDISVISHEWSNDISIHATSIDSYFPNQYVTILEGCTAECTSDCTFSPTQMFIGPTKIDCLEGRCSGYSQDTFDCGDDIEIASDSYGSFQTLLGGSNTVSTFSGYEGISNSAQPITLPANCTLECSGCSTHVDRKKRNMRVGKLFTFMDGT